MIEILKADRTHVQSIQRLLAQLGYESQESEIVSALSLEDKNSDIFVAVSGAKVVALMSLIYFHYFPLQKFLCRITAIVVDVKIRGSGIGRKLIYFAANQARAKSCVQLEVTTSLAREATQAYYDNLGFKKTSYRYYLNLD